MTERKGRAILGTILCILATAGLRGAQEATAGQNAGKLEFEVASIKPTAMDRATQPSQAGQVKLGAEIYGNRAEYRYMTLRQLVAEAYQVMPFQIVCPDWFLGDRFDVMAKMPAGSRKEDARFMLQSLLAERFILVVHREAKEEAIAALLVGQGGPKLKESPSEPPWSSGHAEGEAGEKARQAAGKKNSGSGVSGTMGGVAIRVTADPANSSVRFEGSRVTMADLARFLTNLGAGDGRPVMDMTGLKGQYEIALDIPMPVPGATPAEDATDSGGGRMMRSLGSFGLDLKKMKAPVEHLVVDHAEKKPTAN